MKVLGPKNLRCKANITRRKCPRLTITAWSLDQWSHCDLANNWKMIPIFDIRQKSHLLYSIKFSQLILKLKTEKKISDLNWHFYWKSMSILCFATKTDPQCCCSAFLLIFPHFCNRRNVFFLWCTMRPPAACLWDYRLLIFSSIFLLLFALQMKAPKALILDQNSFLYPLHSDAKFLFLLKKNFNKFQIF